MPWAQYAYAVDSQLSKTRNQRVPGSSAQLTTRSLEKQQHVPARPPLSCFFFFCSRLLRRWSVSPSLHVRTHDTSYHVVSYHIIPHEEMLKRRSACSARLALPCVSGADFVEILPTDVNFCEDCSYQIGLSSATRSSYTVSFFRSDEGCESHPHRAGLSQVF